MNRDLWKEFVALYSLTNKYLLLPYEDFAKCFVRVRRYEINKIYNELLFRELRWMFKYPWLYYKK